MIQRLTFVKIVGTLLQTLSFNFTVVGGPTLVPGPLGGLALLLNGVDQYMDLTKQPADGCLWDLDMCDLGLTVSFKLKVTEVRNVLKLHHVYLEIQHPISFVCGTAALLFLTSLFTACIAAIVILHTFCIRKFHMAV